jgi:hypothetical protein
MPHRVLAACAAVAAALFAAPAARAHAVHIDWKIAGTELVVVASFDNDLPADDAEVILLGPDDTVIASGKTDDAGTWRAPAPPPGTYRLTVKAFANHSQTVVIDIASPAGVSETQALPGGTLGWLIAGTVTVSVAAILLWLRPWQKRRRADDPAGTDATA